MVEYNKINAKLLSKYQVSKLKTAVKNNEGATLRISSKVFSLQDLHHELFLTQRQITKLRNSIENNMSTGIKLSRAQRKKIVMSGGFRKTRWSVIKNCCTVSNKSLTSSGIKCCNEWY